MKITREEQNHQLMLRSTLITVLATGITLTGLLGIYRTLAISGEWQDFLLKQSIWALAAWSIFFALQKISFEQLMRWSLPLAGVGALSLLLLPFSGTTLNGMTGWYSFGELTIQPSEIIKVFYILALTWILCNKTIPEVMRFVLALGVIGVFALLLLIQPDFGTMSVYLLAGAGTLFFCRIKWRYLLATVAGAALIAAGTLLCHDYMRRRLIHFLDPSLDPTGGSWHLRQFAIAVARGEWFGVKTDMAVWSNSFLPLAHNDSIFAGVCEITGFCGGILLLLFYGAFFQQIFMLSYWRRDPFRRSVIDSLAFMLLVQTILHIWVNLNLLPPTGITLPLISYGGSSITGTMLMIAIIIIAGRKPFKQHPAINIQQ